MGYYFERPASVHDNVRRIVAEEVESAIAVLTKRGTAKQRDKAIHEARKSLKKLRGLVRLLRPLLGSNFQKENRALRDIGRELSELRDARAVIDTFEQLIADQSEAWNPAGVEAMRTGLKRRKAEKEQELDAESVVRSAAKALGDFGTRAAQWSVKRDGFEALAPGLKKTYKAARKGMSEAIATTDPDLYHNWRKRTKDHWYHVRLLSPLWAGTKDSREDSLHKLESSLGEDHNLQVLAEQFRAAPAEFGGEVQVSLFVAAAAAKQACLRAEAIKLGERLYEQRPSRLLHEFQRMWGVWRDEQPENAAPTRKRAAISY